jgi:hypothetical protein
MIGIIIVLGLCSIGIAMIICACIVRVQEIKHDKEE